MPIHRLLDALGFTAGNPNWGYRLRLGVLEISEHDLALMADAMGAAASLRAALLGRATLLAVR